MTGVLFVPPSRFYNGDLGVRIGPAEWAALFVVIGRGGTAPARDVDELVRKAAGRVGRRAVCRRATRALHAVGLTASLLYDAGQYLIA